MILLFKTPPTFKSAPMVPFTVLTWTQEAKAVPKRAGANRRIEKRADLPLFLTFLEAFLEAIASLWTFAMKFKVGAPKTCLFPFKNTFARN